MHVPIRRCLNIFSSRELFFNFVLKIEQSDITIFIYCVVNYTGILIIYHDGR